MTSGLAGQGRRGEKLKAALLALAKGAQDDLLRLDANPGERVHSFRVSLKKYEALLQLLRGRIRKSDRRQMGRLADRLKRELGSFRDEAVAVESAAECLDRKIRPPEEVGRRHVPGGMLAVSGELLVGKVTKKGLKKRLGRTRRRAEKARRKARKKGRAEDYHRWRRRAKDLWYQSAWLEGMLPGVGANAERAKQVGAILGREHDLTVALGSLRDLSEGERRVIGRRRRRLRDEALRLWKSDANPDARSGGGR